MWNTASLSADPAFLSCSSCLLRDGNGNGIGNSSFSSFRVATPSSSCPRVSAEASAQGLNETSRSGARERRLQRIIDARRRREQNKSKYPQWARILEDACKNDKELQEIIGDSVGNAEEMRKRVEERVRRKGHDFLHPKTGSAVPMKVSFREFDASCAYIWIELYRPPSEKDVDVIGSVFRSWYLMGRLGAFNTLNLQISKLPVDQGLSYNEETRETFPAYFHNIGVLEFQDNWARVWADLGTADPVALDVLINSLAAVSSDHVGIKELTFGGKQLGDWDEGMTVAEDGYISYKI